MLVAVGLKEKAFGSDVKSGKGLLQISKEEHSNKSMWFVPQGLLARLGLSGESAGDRAEGAVTGTLRCLPTNISPAPCFRNDLRILL